MKVRVYAKVLHFKEYDVLAVDIEQAKKGALEIAENEVKMRGLKQWEECDAIETEFVAALPLDSPAGSLGGH